MLSVVKSQGKTHWRVSDWPEWEKRNKSLQHMHSRTGAASLRWSRLDSPETLTRSRTRTEAGEERGCAVREGGGARREQYLEEEYLAVWISLLARVLAGLAGELNAACIWHIWGQCLALVKIFQGVVQTLFSCKNTKALKIALCGCSAVSFAPKCQKYPRGIVKTESIAAF